MPYDKLVFFGKTFTGPCAFQSLTCKAIRYLQVLVTLSPNACPGAKVFDEPRSKENGRS